MKDKKIHDLNIPAAEFLAALVSGSATSEVISTTFSRTVRIPALMDSKITALSKMANTSKSAIINELLEVGMESMIEHLEDKALKEFSGMTAKLFDLSNSDLSITKDKIGFHSGNEGQSK